MKTDSELQKDVMEELKWEPILHASEIGVAANNGVVTLSGLVNNFAKKYAAEKAAKRVKDVKAVAVDIEVRFAFDKRKTDSELASAALNALKWDIVVPSDGIQIQVEDGWVRLEGEVEWKYQKNAAEDALRHLSGLRGITNLLVVKPRVTVPLIRDKIKKALERSADIEAGQIDVETNGSKVVLSGKVHTWNERGEVVRAAWSAPGVAEVVDDLTVV